MLESLRVAAAGAERLSPEVRDALKLKFNKETASTRATGESSKGNQPSAVGTPLPGGSFRIVDPQTLENLSTGENGLILFVGRNRP